MTTKAKKAADADAPGSVPPLSEKAVPAAASIDFLKISAHFPGYEKMAGAGKENLDALMKANSALTEGIERISKEMIGLTRRSLEHAASVTSALLDATSIEDVVALQSDFTKSFIDQMLAGTAKLSELGFEVATEAYDPVGTRVERTLAELTKAVGA
jgi:phasin family protein